MAHKHVPVSHAPTIDDCVYHRCIDHRRVGQINAYDSGAECGACIKDYYEGILTMTVSRLGMTSRENFLQRIDELRRIERDPMGYLNSGKFRWHGMVLYTETEED
jgi:hypothetical protein